MSTTLEAYRIFIASPGGLQPIRECFRTTIEKYNEADAIRRGAIFIPVGWEATLGGIGRPQEIINDDLSECDYCVLVLHDRWGTPATTDPKGRTGTREEFDLALELYADSDKPMQRIVVFFLSVDPAKMSDPGPQLQQVLDFRKEIETEKKLLYRQIGGADDFADVLRGHLAQWVRDHESRESGATAADTFETTPAAPHETLPPVLPDLTAADPDAPLAVAARLVEEGNYTEAERQLATIAAKHDNPAALLAYGDLLARLDRRREAATAFEEATSLADAAGEPEISARALLALAWVRDRMALGRAAEVAGLRAGSIFETIGEIGGMARSHAFLAQHYRRTDRHEAAEKEYRQALDLTAKAGDRSTEADLWLGLSEVFRDQERLAEAREALDRGIQAREDLGITDLGDAYASLGAILETMEDYEGAEKHYRLAFDLFRERGDQSGMADAADHLGQIRLRQGDLEGAETAFRESASMFEVLQNLEGAADTYLSLGRVQRAKGNLDAAEASLRSALSLANRRSDPPARVLREEIIRLLEEILAQRHTKK